MIATNRRHLVQRHRAGEAAPSLSLSYSAPTAAAALALHFARYPGGVADGERYVVRCGAGRTTYSTEDARRIARAVELNRPRP